MPEAATKDDIDAVNRRLDDLINIGRVGLTAVNAHTTQSQITEINRRLGRIETCGAQKLVMQQRGKCGVTLQAQVRRRSLGMLAEGGALLLRMDRLGPTSGAVASDCNR
jgi:hypothetical protein